MRLDQDRCKSQEGVQRVTGIQRVTSTITDIEAGPPTTGHPVSVPVAIAFVILIIVAASIIMSRRKRKSQDSSDRRRE